MLSQKWYFIPFNLSLRHMMSMSLNFGDVNFFFSYAHSMQKLLVRNWTLVVTVTWTKTVTCWILNHLTTRTPGYVKFNHLVKVITIRKLHFRISIIPFKLLGGYFEKMLLSPSLSSNNLLFFQFLDDYLNQFFYI